MVQVDLNDNRQPDLYAAVTIPVAFSSLAVGLRFWCRWIMKAGWRLDDWLILSALVCAWGLTSGTLWWTPRAFGKHLQAFGADVGPTFNLGLFIAELTYTGVIVCVKFSMLALYWRIFKRANMKIPIIVFSATVAAWGVAVVLLTLLQCVPTVGFWDPSVEASCNVDANSFLFAISIPNILTDVGLLILPVPYIYHMNISRQQKRIISSIFLLGGFVCIASILRLVSVIRSGNSPDVTWTFVDVVVWATIEANFGIIAASLPCLRPVWTSIKPKFMSTNITSTPDRGIRTFGNATRPSKKSQDSNVYGTSLFGSQGDYKDDSHILSETGNCAESTFNSKVTHEIYPATSIPFHPPNQIVVTKNWNNQYERAE